MKKFISFILLTLMLFSFFANTAAAFQASYEPDTQNFPQTPKEVLIKNYILNKLRDCTAQIDIANFGLKIEDAKQLFCTVLNENSSVLSPYIEFEYVSEADTVKYVNVTYPTFAPMLLARDEIDIEVQNILACVDSSMTDVEKALAVHDYFMVNYNYDYTYTNYSKESLFRDKLAVCAAYSEAYAYIMNDLLGIPCVELVSWPMNHSWNIIKLGGKWYQLDTTWDDTYKASHLYFLLSDSAMADDERKHHSWQCYHCPSGCTEHKATSTKYDDYFWKYVDSKILEIGDYYYFIRKTRELTKRNIKSGAESVLYTIPTTWSCYNKPGYHWIGSFSGLEYHNGRLYLNTNSKILMMDLYAQNITTVTTQDTNEGYIYNLYIKNNKLFYDISRDAIDYGIESQKYLNVYSYGDLDSNGVVSSADSIVLSRLIANWSSYGKYNDISAADINNDNIISALDSTILARVIANWTGYEQYK